ncbi:hypothetical protein BaRGS_00020288, partial [Batillaria attramentaria]
CLPSNCLHVPAARGLTPDGVSPHNTDPDWPHLEPPGSVCSRTKGPSCHRQFLCPLPQPAKRLFVFFCRHGERREWERLDARAGKNLHVRT